MKIDQHPIYLRQLLILLAAVALAGCNRGAASAEPTVKPGKVTVIQVTPTATFINQAAGTNFEQRAVLANIADTILLPWHEQLVEEATQLDLATERFAAEPSAQNLDAVQARWRSTSNLWAKLELFDFQFTMVLRNQIKKWPANTELIEEFITAEESIGDAFVASKGSHAKGLAAIEYLVFNPLLSNSEIAAELAAQPTRMAYLEGLTAALPTVTTELLSIWSPNGKNNVEPFIASTVQNGGIEGSFTILINAIIYQMELIERNKIGIPLRGRDAFAQPDAVESPYATYSTDLVKHNLIGIQQLMEAGVYDYLLSRQSQYDGASLVGEIERQFTQTFAALELIEEPLSVSVAHGPKPVADAWEHVKDLSRRFEVDMANHVGLVVTFGLNDGD